MPLTDEEKKIKKAEYQKEYREKNKAKIKEENKKYYELNKEKAREYKKEYREKNKEQIKEYIKEYYELNKGQLNYKNRVYQKTPNGKKTTRITHWKQRGVISNNFDELYETYLSQTNCEECNVELTYNRNTTPTTKCLDHNHETGEFRNILCQRCNVRRK